MMAGMYGGDYFKAVRKTFFAETVSMNFVMTGMIPTMVILASLWEDSMNPLEPTFWFRMSLASVVGGIIAFAINVWLVKNHLKHGCMTLPGADGPAHGLGHRSPEASAVIGDSRMEMEHEQHGLVGMAMSSGRDSMEDVPMQHEQVAPAHDHSMSMRELSAGKSLSWIAGTWVMLLAAVWLTSRWVPIIFS